ncbi:MAG: exo-alpha-sialidase [candidate division WOR-3 bacterium]
MKTETNIRNAVWGVYLHFFVVLNFPPIIASAQWEPNVRLTYNDSTSQLTFSSARSAVASGDYIHIVWEDWRNGGSTNTDIYYIRSTNRGTTWQPEVCLTPNPSNQTYASIATDGPNVHVVWSDYRDTPYGHEIYYKRSMDNGVSWGPDTRLTFIAETLDCYRPAIAVADNDIHVAWETIGFGAREHIFYMRSTDNGTTWGTPIQVSSSVPGNKYKASIAVDNTDVHIVWNDDRHGFPNLEIYYIHSLDGGLTWGPEIRLTEADNYSVEPCIAVQGSTVYVAWGDERNPGNMEVYYKYSTDRGINWSQDYRLTNVSQTDGCPSIAVSGTNVHIAFVSWRTGYQEIFYKNSTNGGATWSSDTRFTFDNNASSHPCVAISGSYVYVVWYDGQGVTWPNFEIWFKRNPTGNVAVEENNNGEEMAKNKGELSIVPNPFAEFFTIKGHEDRCFRLYDLSGQQIGVYKGDRIGDKLPAGLYFVVSDDKNILPARVVKIR